MVQGYRILIEQKAVIQILYNGFLINMDMKAREFINEGQYDHLEPEQQSQHIENERVLSLDMSPYELTKLMREFRSGTNSYNEVNDNAMVAFYSEEESAEFQKYLRSKGVSYKKVGGDS